MTFTYILVNADTRTAFVGNEYAVKSSASRAARNARGRQSAEELVDVMVMESCRRDSYLEMVRSHVDVVVFP